MTHMCMHLPSLLAFIQPSTNNIKVHYDNVTVTTWYASLSRSYTPITTLCTHGTLVQITINNCMPFLIITIYKL